MSTPEVTLPHERELVAIIQLAMGAYATEKPFLALVLTDSEEHTRYLIGKLHKATGWDSETKVKLHRSGIETSEGGKIVIRSINRPELLMGLHPDRIILFGRIGEMYYWLKTMDAEIEAVA